MRSASAASRPGTRPTVFRGKGKLSSIKDLVWSDGDDSGANRNYPAGSSRRSPASVKANAQLWEGRPQGNHMPITT